MVKLYFEPCEGNFAASKLVWSSELVKTEWTNVWLKLKVELAIEKDRSMVTPEDLVSSVVIVKVDVARFVQNFHQDSISVWRALMIFIDVCAVWILIQFVRWQECYRLLVVLRKRKPFFLRIRQLIKRFYMLDSIIYLVYELFVGCLKPKVGITHEESEVWFGVWLKLICESLGNTDFLESFCCHITSITTFGSTWS